MSRPTMADIPGLTKDVPNKYLDHVTNMAQKTISHPYYGKQHSFGVDNFELGCALGRGKFGRVYLAREKITKFIVAMKVMFKSELITGRVEKQVLREIEIQSRLNHPNILRLYTWFHDERKIYLALEVASKGELYSHLRKCGRFPEPRAAKYTYQVAAALHYCHLNNVIHRDLKPENLMLTSDDNIKLADFGWSAHSKSNQRKTMCGTLDYLPPEMVNGESYDNSVDQWCLGVLCYEFVVGKPPFESESTEDTYKRIRSLQMIYPPFLSQNVKNLISRLLQIANSARITLVQVMEHPWIKDNLVNN